MGTHCPFQSTCPARGTTTHRLSADNRARISIHVPREGHDVTAPIAPKPTADFNPRAPRGARRRTLQIVYKEEGISIHVPREGHDPCGEHADARQPQFQSTCPARGTTIHIDYLRKSLPYFNPRAPRGARLTIQPRVTGAVSYFNPRAPRGARRSVSMDDTCAIRISIHVPREGHDVNTTKRGVELVAFQSTCPARGTTVQVPNPNTARGISIHVPREGHDLTVGQRETAVVGISIHVPREGHDSKHAQFFRADLRKSYKYPAERDALPTKNVCKHIKTLG